MCLQVTMDKKQRQSKIRQTLKEFKAGTLKSSSGEAVKNPRQALAIALSQSGMSRKPKADMSDEYYMGFLRSLQEAKKRTKRRMQWMKALAKSVARHI